MTAALTLPEPVAVEAIAEPLDRFHCPVYDARLTARSCLDRQRAAREAGPRSHYGKCFDCEIGKRVADQLNAPRAADIVQRCAFGQCKAGRVDGDYCVKHARVARAQGIAPRPSKPLEPPLAAQPSESLPSAVRTAIAQSAARVRAAFEHKKGEEVPMAKCAKDGCEAGATRGRFCAVHFRCSPEAASERAAHRKALEPHLKAITPKAEPPAPERCEHLIQAPLCPVCHQRPSRPKKKRKPSDGPRGAHPGFVDLSGQELAGAVVLERAPNVKGCARWRVRAACGHERVVVGFALRAAHREGRSVRCEECSRKRPRSVTPADVPAVEAEAETEESNMATICKQGNCVRPVDPKRGGGDLCMPHWRASRVQAAAAKKRKSVKKAQPARRSATPKRETSSLTDALEQAREAIELVDAIGWDLARQLAARVRGE